MTSKHFDPIHDKSFQIIEFLMSSPDMPADESLLFKIRLSVEETVENVVRYAYAGGIGWMDVSTSLDYNQLELTIVLKDAGKPFNPLALPDPDVTLDADEREIGGLGIFLCKQMMDDVTYAYVDNCNVLTMKKILK